MPTLRKDQMEQNWIIVQEYDTDMNTHNCEQAQHTRAFAAAQTCVRTNTIRHCSANSFSRSDQQITIIDVIKIIIQILVTNLFSNDLILIFINKLILKSFELFTRMTILS